MIGGGFVIDADFSGHDHLNVESLGRQHATRYNCVGDENK